VAIAIDFTPASVSTLANLPFFAGAAASRIETVRWSRSPALTQPERNHRAHGDHDHLDRGQVVQVSQEKRKTLVFQERKQDAFRQYRQRNGCGATDYAQQNASASRRQRRAQPNHRSGDHHSVHPVLRQPSHHQEPNRAPYHAASNAAKQNQEVRQNA
jgi:hypothetical protein